MITTVLSETDSHRRVLTHYAPGEECRAHRHAGVQVSLLLAGDYVEDSPEGARAVAGSSLSFKPRGFEHQNLFGEAGALILSLHGKDQAQAVSAYVITRLETRLAGTRGLERASGGATDLKSCEAATGRGMPGGRIDAGLREARQRLLAEQDLSVAALARSMDLHPVHLARLFNRAFGQSPARMRRDVRAARAIGGIVRSTASFADIALDQGFADQAHMTRVVGQVSGWSPGQLRRLLGS